MNRAQALARAIESTTRAETLARDAANAAREGWDGNGAAEAATAFATLAQAYAALVDLLPPATVTVTARRVIRPLSANGARVSPRVSEVLEPQRFEGVYRVQLDARIAADAPPQAVLHHDPIARPHGGFQPRVMTYVVQDDLDLGAIRAAGVEVSE